MNILATVGLDDLKEEYKEIKNQKIELLSSLSEDFKNQYEVATIKLKNTRHHLHEITQAIHAGRKARNLLETAINDFRLALKTNNREMMMKDDTYNKMKKAEDLEIANISLDTAESAMNIFAKELRDIEFEVVLGSFDNIEYDFLGDMLFDNLISDLRLKRSIQNRMSEIKRVVEKVSKILSQLVTIENTFLKQEEALEIEINKLTGL